MATETARETIILTNKGQRIKTTSPVRFFEFHQSYYVDGFRWIKSKGSWSTSELTHGGIKSYEVEK